MPSALPQQRANTLEWEPARTFQQYIRNGLLPQNYPTSNNNANPKSYRPRWPLPHMLRYRTSVTALIQERHALQPKPLHCTGPPIMDTTNGRADSKSTPIQQ